MNNPTPPEIEVVVEYYVSLDENDTERIIEIEEVIIKLKKSNEECHE